MGELSLLTDNSRQMAERALTMRLLRHQNVLDSEEPVMLAQDLLGAGRVRDARLVCMTALHKDSADVDLLLTGAGVAEALGELVDARTLLVKAARLAPKWIEPMVQLARLLYRMEDFGRAWAAVERCYAIDPTSAETCALRADIEQAHRLTLRKNRFLSDEHADDAAMLANALVAKSRFDDALAVLDYALERDGEDADALFVKGTILKARGEREQAEIALRRVTQMECGWVEAWETMADLLEEAGDRAHSERLRAHAATIEVDPLMLVDMAVIAGAREAAFNDLTMSEDLDRAVAAGVSAMSDLKRSLVKTRPPVDVPELNGVNASMLICDVGSMFSEKTESALDLDEDALVEDLKTGAQELDEFTALNPSDICSSEDTQPLGTYKPTVPRPGTVLFTTAVNDSERPDPRQNSCDAQELDVNLAASQPSSLLAPPQRTLHHPVSVRRIIDVYGYRDERREEVCVIRDGQAQPVSALLEETDSDLDALLADDTFCRLSSDGAEGDGALEVAGEAHTSAADTFDEYESPVLTAAGEENDEELFPFDAETEAFASIDIQLDFPIDTEAEAFPSIDVDLAPLSTPAPAEAALVRTQLVKYLASPEFTRAGARAHHSGSVSTGTFDGVRCTLRICDGTVTLESPRLTPNAASAETQQALAELMNVQASAELSLESKAAFDALFSLQAPAETEADVDLFEGLDSDDTDTLFDGVPAEGSEVPETPLLTTRKPSNVLELLMETTSAPVETACVETKNLVVKDTNLSDAGLVETNFADRNNEDDDIAIPLSVRKAPRSEPVFGTQPVAQQRDLRAEILAAAGVDSNTLETALQATRLPANLKKAEAELDSFLAEVETKRPRLRMRSKGTPYRPPSPRDLFPKNAQETDPAGELNAR